MKTYINEFGENITKWQSHKHPDNIDYQQVVFWKVTEKTDGKVLVSYHLGEVSRSKHFYNLTKDEALSKYVD